MPGQADGIPPRTCWPGSPAYMKMNEEGNVVEVPIGWWCPCCGWLINDITPEKIIAIHDALIALHNRAEDQG